jgi:hypothetical protein
MLLIDCSNNEILILCIGIIIEIIGKLLDDIHIVPNKPYNALFINQWNGT